MAPLGKYWVFTKNGVEENSNTAHEDLVTEADSNLVTYAVWQLERGSNGNLHYQGYVEFKTNKRPSACEHLIQGCHWERRMGTASEARAYCMKEDSRVLGPWEFGQFVDHGQGKRTDLLTVKAAIDAGATDLEVADQHFGTWVRFHKAFSIYRLMKSPPRNFKSQVIVLYGPTGIGKSMWGRDNTRGYAGHGFFAFDGKWFDNYSGTDDVVIDDFTGWIEYNKLLRYLDEYPSKVESKNGVINFAPRRIVITSNLPWWEWYDWTKVRGTKEALERRLDHVFTFSGLPNVHVVKEFFEGLSPDELPKDPWPIEIVVSPPTPPAADPIPDLHCDEEAEDAFEELYEAARQDRRADFFSNESDEERKRDEQAQRLEEVIQCDTEPEFDDSPGESLTLAQVEQAAKRFRELKRKNPFIEDEAGCSD